MPLLDSNVTYKFPDKTSAWKVLLFLGVMYIKYTSDHESTSCYAEHSATEAAYKSFLMPLLLCLYLFIESAHFIVLICAVHCI